MIVQPLPQSIEMEKCVLGCLLMDKSDYVLKLKENDFTNQTNQLVYKAIRYMLDKHKAIDPVSVADILAKKLENALDYCVDLTAQPSTSENIEHYITALKDYSLRREVIKRSREAEEEAFKGEFDNGVDFKSNIQQKFDIQVYDGHKEDFTIQNIMVDIMSDIDKKYNSQDDDKLFTGYYDFDKITAGLHEEELSIIAARPGVGKTAFALQLMIQLAKKDNHCLFVSREMSTMQVGKRILANIAQVDGQKLRLCKSLTEDDFDKIAQANGCISTLPIEINDKIATIQEIRSYCRELKTKHILDVLIIDYLQLMRTMKKCDSRRLEIDDISRQLKEISLEFHIPVIALSQLSREAVGAGEPELHHLKESGGLEQDADNVFFLHVPKDTDETADSFDIKVIIGKQRNGATGYIMLKYYRKTFKFCNISMR